MSPQSYNPMAPRTGPAVASGAGMMCVDGPTKLSLAPLENDIEFVTSTLTGLEADLEALVKRLGPLLNTQSALRPTAGGEKAPERSMIGKHLIDLQGRLEGLRLTIADLQTALEI